MTNENNFEITNVDVFTNGKEIYISMEWTGDESKVDNLFVDLLDADKEVINDRIYPEAKVTFGVPYQELDLLDGQSNEFIFHLALYDKIINEVDGSFSKEELLAFKGPFKVSFDFKRKLFGECITNLKLENPVAE